jgi:hypothetical protein
MQARLATPMAQSCVAQSRRVSSLLMELFVWLFFFSFFFFFFFSVRLS